LHIGKENMNYSIIMALIQKADKPSDVFLHNSFVIEIPELYTLQGIPQPAKYHPEGDAFVHTLQVIDRAKELGGNDITIFSCLLHDLGKALTPKEEWPHAYNHESLGLPIAAKICERLNVPIEHRDFVLNVVAEHGNAHRFLEMRPTTRVKFLKRIWLCNLYDFTLACKADSQGRGEENWLREYPQSEAIMDAARRIGKIEIAGKSHEKWLQEAAKAIS